MCLIVFAWESHPEYRLVLAANRDEFHNRPARDLDWWPDQPELLAGRDLQAGGTWLAASRNGRFATVTNYREGQPKKAGLKSRGDLVTDFVSGDSSPESFVGSIDGLKYAGFSLLVATDDELWYVSNRGDGPCRLEPGIYGLSNASLDTPWSKLTRSRDALAAMIESGDINETALMRILADRTPAPVADVEDGNLPFELARAVTAPFIVAPDYGTRCTTAVTWRSNGNLAMTERRFDSDGRQSGETTFRFAVSNDLNNQDGR